MSGVDDYLAALPPDQREALEHVRATIRAAAPDATEAISYGMPAFKQDGRGLVGYAAFKVHCSLFPMSSTVIADLAGELAGYVTSKGTIRFTPGEPLPDALITRIVHARLAELAARG
jgi:uncharacterized protein YdhG (YjbR/CyaY superfamily)